MELSGRGFGVVWGGGLSLIGIFDIWCNWFIYDGRTMDDAGYVLLLLVVLLYPKVGNPCIIAMFEDGGREWRLA